MTDRWGDSRADRDALDRWLTTEPEEAEVESRLYLVALEGPPSKWNAGPETMGVWAVADSPEAAAERAWEKVHGPRRGEWKVSEVRDHGTPRPADQVDYVADEPSPGLRMERLVAHPWAEHPGGDLTVTATPARGGASGFTVSWPGGGGHTVQEARDLAAALLAVTAAAEERWGS
jgi:hypothetical protein